MPRFILIGALVLAALLIVAGCMGASTPVASAAPTPELYGDYVLCSNTALNLRRVVMVQKSVWGCVVRESDAKEGGLTLSAADCECAMSGIRMLEDR